jgi:hypothetical protein
MERTRHKMRNGSFDTSGGQLLRACVFLVVFGLSGQLKASQVTFTITGTVLGGIDQTGVFGFSPETSLDGQSFLLVYTFHDQIGQESMLSFNGIPYESSVTGTGSQSPGTATLTINGVSFMFGRLPAKYTGTTVSSTATRNVRLTGASASNSAEEDVEDFYLRVGHGIEDNYVNTRVAVQTSGAPMTTDYDWRSSFTYTLTPLEKGSSSAAFQVRDETDLPAFTGAYGQLNMHTITVSGFNETSAVPEPGTLALWGMGVLGLLSARCSRKFRRQGA